MTKGILRVPKGTVTGLVSILQGHFPGYVVETYDPHKPDYRLSYQKKVDSYCQAFEYLLEAYPRSLTDPHFPSEVIKTHIEQCRQLYTFNANTATRVSELQKELKTFTTSLVDTIRLLWNKSGEDATELLNEAEQYVLMLRGRPDLVTLTPMGTVQVDKALLPYEQETLEEFYKIKAENCPKTPHWFQELSEPELHFRQVYFCNLPSDVTDLVDDFEKFLTAWDGIKLNALSLKNDLEQIAGLMLPLPKWFEDLPMHQQKMIFSLANEDELEIDKRLKLFEQMLAAEEYKGTFSQVRKLPQWYWVLPEHQQYLLEHALKSNERLDKVFSFICSRHRSLPLLPNYAVHSSHIIDKDGNLQDLYTAKYRGSHVVPRDGVDEWPKEVIQLYTYRNLTRAMAQSTSEQLLLVQTLVSPIHLPGINISKWLPDGNLKHIADTQMAQHPFAARMRKTNHPFNAAKVILYTVATDPDIEALVTDMEARQKTIPQLKPLLLSYKAVLNSGVGTTNFFDYYGRELFLSSLEQLMFLVSKDYSFGSCVSGKDRKAIESIHTDAMCRYKYEYGFWPEFSDLGQDRINFINIFVDIYLSRHHHEHAGHNAPGSEGIKTPSKYLPADIAAEIIKRINHDKALIYDDRLATNNELRKVTTGSPILPKEQLGCSLIAAELGEEKCTALYDTLFLLFNDMSQFVPPQEEKKKSWGAIFFSSERSAPTGIVEIKKLMDDPRAGPTNIVRMAGIMKIILSRPVQDSSRTEATKSVYELRQLIDAPALKHEELVNKLTTDLTKLFEKNKHSKKVTELSL
ncbi:oxidoreductase [Legionella lytica]|uniref:Oxidoreductase n=1 Tax=Legionella lytica TaxID=96232 RepID=A0ABY4Y7E5_9GAMM|nr:oxidoreductase [Legionella lytica]USQ13548.1 oxidoreductase [Legionella lytica]